MSLIDFILNLVGLLLWVNWRSMDAKPLVRPGVSLASALKPAGPSGSRWLYLVALVGMLLVRAFMYWEIGPALPWNPCIPMGPTALAFRSDVFGKMLFFSLFSFGASLTIFYLWLILLSCINSHISDNDPQQRFVRQHLGVMDGLPWFMKAVVPLVLVTVVWFALHPLLMKLRMAPPTTPGRLVGQGLLISVSVYLSLKFLLAGLLTLHLITSYVYLGEMSFWNYINITSRGLLRPLKLLQLGRIDFAPVAGIAVVLGVAWGMSLGLNKLYCLLAR